MSDFEKKIIEQTSEILIAFRYLRKDIPSDSITATLVVAWALLQAGASISESIDHYTNNQEGE